MEDNQIKELRQQKQSRFLQLLEWEQYRAEQSAKHKKILKSLISRILQKVSISKETNIAVLKFLKERAIGSLSYSEALNSEKAYLPDPSHPRLGTTLSAGLSAISEYQSQLALLFVSFSEKIE